MSVFGDYIKEVTPPFNMLVAEGICYNTMKNGLGIIEDFLEFTSNKRTSTHLKFLGIRMLSPEEEVAQTFKKKNNKYPYKMEENSTYMAEMVFQYADEEEPLVYYSHVPYLKKYNEMMLSDKPMVVQPTLSNLIISIGERVVFIDILTAKHNFHRTSHSVRENDSHKMVTVATAELYRNNEKKFPDTTKAKPSIIHYLLAYYGFAETMLQTLGFIPEVVYDVRKRKGKVVISSSGTRPDGWRGIEAEYIPSTIAFLVDEDKYDANVLYVLGNVMYVIDNFPEKMSIDQLNEPLIWRRFMGEIILGGRNTLSHRHKFMNIHFGDLDSQFLASVIQKLEEHEEPIYANTLIKLMVVIFKNFNSWISRGNKRSLYGNKSLESSSVILKSITSGINKVFLDVNKEEMRIDKEPVDLKIVKQAFREHLSPYLIFSLKRERLFVSNIEDPTDHGYFKRTALMNYQESDPTNIDSGGGNTSSKKKLVASMCTIGSLYNLPKKDPHCLSRTNLDITLDPKTHIVLPDPLYNEVIERTDLALSQTHIGSTSDIGDSDSEEGLLDEIREDQEYEIDYDGCD